MRTKRTPGATFRCGHPRVPDNIYENRWVRMEVDDE
jgi:hypothetical protein